MNLYDLLLDELISKSHTQLDREQVDKLVTQLALAANSDKVSMKVLMLDALRQALEAYGVVS